MRDEKSRQLAASLTGAGGQETWHVLKEKPSSGPNKFPCDPGELKEQAGPLTLDPSPLSSDAPVLARGASGDEINTGDRTSEWNSWPFSVGASSLSVHFSGSLSSTLR